MWPLMAGMLLNAIVVSANHGLMPVSRSAADAAGLTAGSFHNVSDHAHTLAFLGDVFALPRGLPLSNTFSYFCASVPMSKSFGLRPRIRSRTLPPTR